MKLKRGNAEALTLATCKCAHFRIFESNVDVAGTMEKLQGRET